MPLLITIGVCQGVFLFIDFDKAGLSTYISMASIVMSVYAVNAYSLYKIFID